MPGRHKIDEYLHLYRVTSGETSYNEFCGLSYYYFGGKRSGFRPLSAVHSHLVQTMLVGVAEGGGFSSTGAPVANS